MSRKQRGFTLIELMIVIAIIAIIAAIAIPNLLAARLSANETAAIATLRNITSAQAQFQQSAKADQDDDGTGEYGGFLELSGALPGRMLTPLVPPVLSGAFRIIELGAVSRSGYFFKMYLPAPTNDGVPEPDAAGYQDDDGVTVDNNLAETTWCCYAWPVGYNQSGNRTFFTNQAGDVLACESAAYDGDANDPEADAAFTVGGDITSPVAINLPGQNADATAIWRQVN